VRRAAWLLLVLVGGWLLTGVVVAGPASAHATLVSTQPAEGGRVATAPSAVTLEFSEGVSLGAGYARVVAADGARVDSGAAEVDGATLTIPISGDLPEGGYLVSYRVISADAHPISGAYSFAVGDGELVPTGTGAEDPTDPGVATALPVFRWLGFGALALAVGVPVLALVCWPGGWASDRLRRLTTWGAFALAAAAAVSFLLQGPYAAGTGVGSALDPSNLEATAGSGNGWALLVRLVLALALPVVLRPAWHRGVPPSRGRLVAAGVLAGGLVVTTAAVGHPVAGPLPGLAVAVTVVHVAAMTVWLGGLAALLAAVLRPTTAPDHLAAVLPRFSRLAFGAVVALVVTGAVQSVREVAEPAALVSTTYGWVLVAKLVLVAVVLGAAGVSRVWVQQRLGMRRSRPAGRRSVIAHAFAAPVGGAPGSAVPEEEDAAEVRTRQQAEGAVEELPALRRSVLVEVVLAAAVLALSAVLVGTPPARAAIAQPVDVLLPLQGSAGPEGSLQVSVDPARPGVNTLHVYLFDDTGRPTQPVDIRVSLTEREQDIGPLAVGLLPAGPGHYVGDGMSVPGAGTWTLTVTVRQDEFTATTASTDFPVR
jgi:copper transport protein